MAKKQITIDAPKVPVVRYRFRDTRHIDLDLRGIRNPHSPLRGRLNPSKGTRCRWLSPEHLECMINEYFESCNGPLFDKYGNLLRDAQGNIVKGQVKPYTMSGLALYLGISTMTLKRYRDGLVDDLLEEMKAETEDVKTFSRVVLQAKQKIESYAEGRLYDRDGQRGAQFVLDCCFGWVNHKEKSEIKRAKTEMALRKQELELKQKLMSDEGEDSNLTINIVSRSDNDDQQHGS